MTRLRRRSPGRAAWPRICCCPASWRVLADAPDLPALAERLRTGREPVRLTGPARLLPCLERPFGGAPASGCVVLARWCVERPGLLERPPRRRGPAEPAGCWCAGWSTALRPRTGSAGTLPTPALPHGGAGDTGRPADRGGDGRAAGRLAPPGRLRAGGAPRRRATGSPRCSTPRSPGLSSPRALRPRPGWTTELRWYVPRLLDLENVLTALALAAAPSDRGARAPRRGRKRRARRRWSGSPARGRGRGAARGPGGLRGHAASSAPSRSTEPSRLAEHLAAVTARPSLAGRAPTHSGSAPVLDYLLRLREEVERFQRLAWALALGAPPLERLGEVYAR